MDAHVSSARPVPGRQGCHRILLIFGTRPEAIKMEPVLRALRQVPGLDVKVCVTAQHRLMLDQVLSLFDIVPEFDLDLMQGDQDQTDIASRILVGMREVFRQWHPDLAVVHGDTTTAMAAGLAAFYAKVPVAHVEAGLRSHTIHSPWPEEMNRRLVGRIASLHFAPTAEARANLLAEGCAQESVFVTGNTATDAVLNMVDRMGSDSGLARQLRERFAFLDEGRKLVLVTGHRRENLGRGLERICEALGEIAGRGDVEIVYPVHLNPGVQEPVRRILGGSPRIHLMEPLEYLPFVYLMQRAYMILTDSGGIQEEATALGKPVLLMREITERPEAIEAGTVRLVGTDARVIADKAHALLDDPIRDRGLAGAHNPYGAGDAAQRIAAIIAGLG
jgi:UDP-N-acetylglucosamine 2-epimerase (non-hydrolysing)